MAGNLDCVLAGRVVGPHMSGWVEEPSNEATPLDKHKEERTEQ